MDNDSFVTVFCTAALAAIIAIAIYVNIWAWKRRSKITPEERHAEHELQRRNPGDW